MGELHYNKGAFHTISATISGSNTTAAGVSKITNGIEIPGDAVYASLEIPAATSASYNVYVEISRDGGTTWYRPVEPVSRAGIYTNTALISHAALKIAGLCVPFEHLIRAYRVVRAGATAPQVRAVVDNALDDTKTVNFVFRAV